MPTVRETTAALADEDVLDATVAALANVSRAKERMWSPPDELVSRASRGCTCQGEGNCARCGLTAIDSILRWLSTSTNDGVDSPVDVGRCELLDELEADYRPDPRYLNATYDWVKVLPPRQTGVVGEKVTRRFLTSQGCVVGPRTHPGHDLVADDARVEVKTSTLWQGTDHFRFSQLRSGDHYDVVALIGVEPERVRMWLVSRERLLSIARGQHTGAGSKETNWVVVDARRPPRWFGRNVLAHPSETKKRLAKLLRESSQSHAR